MKILSTHELLHEPSFYRNLLRKAHTASTRHDQSGYQVKTALKGNSGTMVTGGNDEYGLGTGIHGESSFHTHFRQRMKMGEVASAFAVVQPKPTGGVYATLCGDCRDLLWTNEDIYPRHCEVVAGAVGTDKIGVARLEDYFCTIESMAFGTIEDASIVSRYQMLLDNAWERTDASWVAHQHLKPYVCVIQSVQGGVDHTVDGAYYGNVAFNETYPLTDAYLAFRRKGISDTSIDMVVLQGESIPHVCYSDRQQLIEIASRARHTIDVILADCNGNTKITDSNAWLPLPFDPRHLL